MQYFWDWAVRPLLLNRDVTRVLEIGASEGGNTDRMLRHLPGVQISVIDPCIDIDLAAKYNNNAAVSVIKGRSLDILPKVNGSFDAILVDGDHNYYTVLHELRHIVQGQLLAPGGVILFHDIGEPWARKDLYYQPEFIPEAARAPGQPQGVLTAIEHFRAETPGNWQWMHWGAEHGLGCLFHPRSGLDLVTLRTKAVAWQGIRWRNRLLRWTGMKPPEEISWDPGRRG